MLPWQARARRAQVPVRGCTEKTSDIILTILYISYDGISCCHDRRAPSARLVRRAPGARRFQFAAVLKRRRILNCNTLHFIWWHFMLPWQARAQRAPRQARARRAQVLVRNCTERTLTIIDNTLHFIWRHFMLPRQARAQRAPRQARAGSSSRLYWKDVGYYIAIPCNTLHFIWCHFMLPWQARAQGAPRHGARRFYSCTAQTRAIIDNTMHFIWCHFMMPWEARARRAQLLVRGSSAQERMQWVMYKKYHSTIKMEKKYYNFKLCTQNDLKEQHNLITQKTKFRLESM